MASSSKRFKLSRPLNNWLRFCCAQEPACKILSVSVFGCHCGHTLTKKHFFVIFKQEQQEVLSLKKNSVKLLLVELISLENYIFSFDPVWLQVQTVE